MSNPDRIQEYFVWQPCIHHGSPEDRFAKQYMSGPGSGLDQDWVGNKKPHHF